MQVRYAPAVRHDARRLDRRRWEQLHARIEATLGAEQLGANADDRPLRGSVPWRRLRLGSYRVIWREAIIESQPARLVARVVDRRDLERAIRTLSAPDD